MPLKKGADDETREMNIKEMIASGHEPEQAVAAAYAHQRKYKKMAEGGMVEDEEFRSLPELNADADPNEMQPPDMGDDDKMIAKMLKKKRDEEY